MLSSLSQSLTVQVQDVQMVI